jgi:hypothetical protein
MKYYLINNYLFISVRFVLQGVHSTFAFEPNDHVYVPHGASQSSQLTGRGNQTAAATTTTPTVLKVNRFVFIGRDIHPKELYYHYQRHLVGDGEEEEEDRSEDRQQGREKKKVQKQKKTTTTRASSVPRIQLESWTGAGKPRANTSWVSSILVVALLYAFSRYREAILTALGLPTEWAWAFVLLVVFLAALAKSFL